MRFSATLKIVNPKLISEREVRMTAISVRSAAMRVRCNARLVFRDANSNELLAGGDCTATRSSVMILSLGAQCAAAAPPTCHARNWPAQQYIWKKGEHEGDDHRLARIECFKHDELINRIHHKPEQNDPRSRDHAFMQA